MSPRNPGPEGIFERWSRLSLRAKGVAVLSVPMAALFIAMVAIYWVEGNVRDADLMTRRADDIRAELLQFHVFLLDAETAVSAFVATGDKLRLTSYEAARVSMQQSLGRLGSLIGGDARS